MRILDKIQTSILSILKQDEIAKRVKVIFLTTNKNSSEKQAKRIQRRDLACKTNPLYLKPSLLTEVYQRLQKCYQENKRNDAYQSALAVCGLMRLLDRSESNGLSKDQVFDWYW